MIRLDKYLVELNIGSRSQVKELIKKGTVTVDGQVEKRPELKIDESKASVCLQGRECFYQKYYYYMLHKPAGVVSATKDREKTVLDLLKGVPGKDLFPVGRLDKNTEGLLLITNDGPLAHELLSPRKHVEKTYIVQTRDALSEADMEKLRQGVDIGEKEKTRNAKVEKGADEKEIYLTITEGKFHQVKRMLQAVSNEVIYLKRIRVGALLLDEKLVKGTYRELTMAEIQRLKEER